MPRNSDVFVDTAGWGYYLHSRDPLHAQTMSVVQGAVRQGRSLITTNYVLAELVTILDRYRMSRQLIVTAIHALKTDPHVEIVHIDPTVDANAWALLSARLDKVWSLVDASSMVLMRQFGMNEVVTTDHHFDQAGFMRLI